MTIYRLRNLSTAVLAGLLCGIVILTGCHPETTIVNPYFDSARQYSHAFYSSEEECRRTIGQYTHQTCSEWIYFDTKGKVSALLGGSDVIIKGTYRLKTDTINAVLQDGPTQVKRMTFKIISDSELISVEENTFWKIY